jgi:lipid II:glycine glycyltransferase (peptidoglycan interpeptide bridge formation enzyme)
VTAGADLVDPDSGAIREAAAEDLSTWDQRAVEDPAGHVYQSVAWGRHRESVGWRTHFLVFDDGFPVLALSRPWRWLPGAGAYLSRGPIPAESAAPAATRLAGVTQWLADRGIDVVATDGEMPADPAYAGRLADLGFRQIEELQPSRHRLDLDLPPGSDEASVLALFGSSTRNLIHQAERQGLKVRRLDARLDARTDAPDEATLEGFVAATPDQVADPSGLLETCYSMLAATADRRGFRLGDRSAFLGWSMSSLQAGQTIYLQVEDQGGEVVAGATFYRHGRRLTYALSGDRAELRREHPGAVRLLVWRAIQIALREGRTTMDLGGVDVPGARRRPREGEPAYGMLQFKESFGATWVELTGAHERVIRPLHYAAGRFATRLAGVLGR